MRSNPLMSKAGPLVALILFQAFSALFFVFDMSADVKSLGLTSIIAVPYLPELGATMGLVLGIAFELRVLAQLMRRQAQLEKGMSVAAGALSDLIQGYYGEWGLTASEQDVAGFTIKGYSIAEIAELRGSAAGTVKTHLNAIYRKAGVAGRAQLVSLLVEDLLRAPLLPARPALVDDAA